MNTGILRVLMIGWGLLGVAQFVLGLVEETPPAWVLALNIPSVLINLAYVYVGSTLSAQLRRRPGAVVGLFIAAMIVSGLNVVAEIVWSLRQGETPIPHSLLAVIIAYLLYLQAKRLVQEPVT